MNIKLIYLASRYSQKEDTRAVAKELGKAGFINTSSWLQEPHEPSTPLHQVSDNDLCEFAQQDMDDIRRADAFVLFSVDPLIPTLRGGRHVEMGYALGLGKPIYVVGPKENIFHYLPWMKHFSCISELIDGIKAEGEYINAVRI